MTCHQCSNSSFKKRNSTLIFRGQSNEVLLCTAHLPLHFGLSKHPPCVGNFTPPRAFPDPSRRRQGTVSVQKVACLSFFRCRSVYRCLSDNALRALVQSTYCTQSADLPQGPMQTKVGEGNSLHAKRRMKHCVPLRSLAA